MKKLGFTLAEVLVTLSIIGVVAAVTLPSLNANVQRAQIGPILAKAVNTLENANRMALQEYETRSLATAANCISGGTLSNYTAIMDRYLSGSRNGSTFRSKDGISYDFTGSVVTGSSPLTNKYHNSAYTVTIDTNGDKLPNAGGEDRYSVLVDFAGTVIPCGGQEENSYNGNTIKNDCRENPTAACTGNIADNGWKVIY